MKTVTFETQCYENDYLFLLTGDRLETAISNCNHIFDKRTVIINKVDNREKVAHLTQELQDRGVIDEYHFAEDYIDQALKHFNIEESSFNGGYYYSRCQLVGLFLSTTDYVLHFTTDTYIPEKNSSTWIRDGIELMENNPKFVCAMPFWNNNYEAARMEAVLELDHFFGGYGFSDNCYLVPTKLFKQRIFNENNQASERYPWYAGNCFEKRVDSYMRNHDLLRLMSKEVSYVHENLPRSFTAKVVNLKNRIVRSFKKYLFSERKHSDAEPLTQEEIAHIHTYRSNIKIYDVFTFFNEFDLLEMRLSILDPYVDYFVIVECAETFSGLPKPLHYEANKERFKKWEHKIIHHVVTRVPKDKAELQQRLDEKGLDQLEREIINYTITSDNIPEGQTHWLKEFYQKESIRKALIGLNNEDICYIGDVDEIWRPETVVDYRKDVIFKLRQCVYPYYLNNRSSEPWAGTLVTKYKNIRHNCLNHLRTVSKTKYSYVQNGGWHFTNQGGAEQIRKKIESYGHQEFNNSAIKSDIENKMKNNQDFIGRKFTFWIDESDLPKYILDNKEKYKPFFKEIDE